MTKQYKLNIVDNEREKRRKMEIEGQKRIAK